MVGYKNLKFEDIWFLVHQTLFYLRVHWKIILVHTFPFITKAG